MIIAVLMKISIIFVICVCLSALSVHSAPPSYQVHRVEGAPFMEVFMNNNGDTALYEFIDFYHVLAAFMPWGSSSSQGINITAMFGLNDAGQVVGYLLRDDNFEAVVCQHVHEVYYSSGNETSSAMAINDKGLIGGHVGNQPATFTISNGALEATMLSSTVYDEPSCINDINNQGHMVGVIAGSSVGGSSVGFYYTPSTGIQTIDLSICARYGLPYSNAYMINEKDTILGFCCDTVLYCYNNTYWILYANQTVTYIGLLQDVIQPPAINDNDEYVFNNGTSWVVTNGGTYNLNDLLVSNFTDVSPFQATAINNKGYIAGLGGDSLAYILVPISDDESETDTRQ